ncbi:MAG: PD-(D/E)XK nuclease family protein [Gammaproteobacteria bacterium]|nr:PD-(D/E)XK nuclease family protein [Gammaproteobacteria bacterium]
MEDDLQKLIDDRRFREFHEKTPTRAGFNTFDVLRYSDYEIRHSNVLGWLLAPSESHGLGGKFLKWFIEHHNEKSGSQAAIPSSVEEDVVRVERELDYVDVTVFLESQNYLIAIENKTVGALSEYFDQVRAYETTLRKRHGPRYTVRSVLLTTSREGTVSQPDFVHVSWSTVIEKIGSLEVSGAFQYSDVRAFVRQYLDAVGRRLAPSQGREQHYTALLGDYRSLWHDLHGVLAREGAEGVARRVPSRGAEMQRTVVKLAKEFGTEPKALRDAVGDFLRHREWTTMKAQNTEKTWFGLYWELSELARELGVESSLRWGMGFEHKGITIGFYLWQWSKKMQPLLERIVSHLQAAPIDRREAARYRMKEEGQYFCVYHRGFLTPDDFAGMTTSGAKEVVLEKLTKFVDSEESDYGRIESYFKCLAFRPDGPGSAGEKTA